MVPFSYIFLGHVLEGWFSTICYFWSLFQISNLGQGLKYPSLPIKFTRKHNMGKFQILFNQYRNTSKSCTINFVTQIKSVNHGQQNIPLKKFYFYDYFDYFFGQILRLKSKKQNFTIILLIS